MDENEVMGFMAVSMLTFMVLFFSAVDYHDTVSHMKAATQSEIENTSYDSLSSHKISDNVSLDVVVNDSTHKQVFITIKKPKCGYQVIVSKNDDGSSSVRPL